jgi:DNA-binding MarR family transcriptional regulator
MEEFEFEQSFGRKLGMAHTALTRHLDKLMKEKNLPITPEQFRLLTHLWKKDGRQQSELAINTHRNRANVTRIIDILEREGIVERRDDSEDRRIFRIYLTDLGKSLEEPAGTCAFQAIEDSLQNVTASEKEMTISVLSKIIHNLR